TNNDVAPALTLVKTVVNDNGGTKAAIDFPLFINGNPVVSGAANALSANVPYTATETTDPGYAASAWGGDCATDGTVTLSPGDDKTCTITNDDNYGTVTVTKFSDEDQDGLKGQNEPVLPGWEIDLSGVKKTTDQNGQVVYDLLVPGSYVLGETEQTGWVLTDIYCTNDSRENGELDQPSDNQHPVFVGQEEQVTCFVGNHFIEPSLTITKSNNKFPVPQTPGSEVEYTITVKANDNDVLGVKVTDLPPAGFEFIPGTEEASSGFLEHVYASPGVWNLGDMAAGETIELKYKTVINGSQDEGLYNDLAFAAGKSEINSDVLADSAAGSNPDDDGIVDANFVGTKVAVVIPDQESVTLRNEIITETDTKTKTKRKTKYVFGASLPDTGANGLGTLLGIALITAGAALLIFKKRKMRKGNGIAILVASIALGGLLVGGGSASAAELSVKMEDPKSNVNSSDFKIGFVALDILGRPVTVKCFEEGSVVPYQIHNLINGGSSGNCVVNSSVMPSDGAYNFYVTAEAGSDDIESAPHETVILDSVGPDTPLDYGRAGGSCSVSFKTADDGQTVEVELYRSTSSNFVANSSTFANDLATGPNTAGLLGDPSADCGAGYYYAVRAVDSSGNGSAFVGDENVTVNTETETRTRTRTRTVTIYPDSSGGAGGAIPATGAGGLFGASEGAVAGEETENIDGEGEGSGQGVLGEETSKDGEDASARSFWKTNWEWLLLIISGLMLIGYGISRRKKNDIEA
ncbi:MAG TPA: hypothetical protein DCX32_01330, partial [Candidatus Moranbacteria bacterium]|nr:hypothetical protein [Candidatus Moranbacteria bacterium]